MAGGYCVGQAFPSLQQALRGCAGLGDMAQVRLLELECACDSARDLSKMQTLIH